MTTEELSLARISLTLALEIGRLRLLSSQTYGPVDPDLWKAIQDLDTASQLIAGAEATLIKAGIK